MTDTTMTDTKHVQENFCSQSKQSKIVQENLGSQSKQSKIVQENLGSQSKIVQENLGSQSKIVQENLGSQSKIVHNVVIIGGGCAGLTAALYAARAELNPLVFVGDFQNKGGLLVKTSVVENYPGFPDGINGSDLIANMEKQAIHCGAQISNETIMAVCRNEVEGGFVLFDSDGTTYLTKSIIIATGSNPNKLHLPNEDIYWGKGISSCAVCDGALYKNQKIVVIGGGDSAMEEALFLTKFSDVTLIHRKDNFRASAVMQKRVLEHKKITIIYNTCVTELIGTTPTEDDVLNEPELTGIVCTSVVDGSTMNIDMTGGGLFYGLGLTPNVTLFTSDKPIQLKMDAGHIAQFSDNSIGSNTSTSEEGIFVAGDASDKIYRQAIVACGDGCKAAMDVIAFLES
jgi:thioredoxin reductase (NADPH)